MKYCIIVPDGAADYPVPRLDDKTPLAVANKPNMDRAAREGLLGLTCHVPHRMPAGSSVAIMSMAGYDPVADYTGRAPLEAADLGLEMGPRDWAVRCNLITAADGKLADSNAGHISTEEARVLVDLLNEELGSDEVSFHVGTGYRHIMLYRGETGLGCETNPPHDFVGDPIRELLPRGPGASHLIDLMRASTEVLADHEVNRVRTDLGKNPANMIWLWGQGRHGLQGGCISAVNLVRGIGKLIGWETIEVPGITGYTDTDYAAKGRYALEALNRLDLVFIHIEAPDEASHDRDVQAKIRSIQAIDREIVGPVMAQADEDGDMRVLICPDHVTSVVDGRHERDEVPFVIWGANVVAESGHGFSESTAAATDVRIEKGHHLMRDFLVV
jgi:2,3-bisphosphoglycerate-independent phosphoglycerate mutase